MTVKGIDISYANKGLDFAKLKAAGIDFVIVRTGYRQKTDDMFHSHMKKAIAAGLDVGAYCYCMAATPAEARKEAEHAVSLLKPYKLSYPVFYDMEDASLYDLSRTKLTNIALAFMETVKKAGCRAGLYANPSWLENKLNRDKILDKYDLWLAHWTGDPNMATKYQYGQTMWQWGSEELSGSNGKVDGDICYVDYPAIIGEGGEQGGGCVPAKGDSVLFIGGRHYGASTSEHSAGSLRSAGTARITGIAPSTPHPYHLEGESSNVYGWVDRDTVFALGSGETGKADATLNLREKAGLEGKILTVIPQNGVVVLFKETESRDGYVWQKAAYNGVTGYLAANYISR